MCDKDSQHPGLIDKNAFLVLRGNVIRIKLSFEVILILSLESYLIYGIGLFIVLFTIV